MDPSISSLIRIIGPQVPLIFKTIGWHTLGWSDTSSKLDLKMELVITVLRSILNNPNPRPLSLTQKFSLRDNGIKGQLWISKAELPKPQEPDLARLVFSCIDLLKEGSETYTQPEMATITAEWTGYRPGVSKSQLPDATLDAAQTYEKLVADMTSNITVLYMHGGAHFMMSAASHRDVVSRLCKLFGGRALNVNYRLSPQHPFPSALMDALMAYVYLLYPPEGASHKAVPAEQIVFAGDSAGGHQSFALLQLLLSIKRLAADLPKSIRVHGQEISLPLPLPAGVAGSSPWLDITRCMPSLEKNAKWDYLPPPSATHEKYPADEIWPPSPPREDLFCNGSILCHPLVSPLGAMDWTGSPPVFFGLGEEMLADENAVVARRLAQQGVSVRWEQFEAMCHCFGMIFEGNATAEMFMAGWGKAIKEMVENPAAIKTEGHFIEAKTLKRVEVDVTKVIAMSDEEVLERMRDVREKKIKGLAGEADVLPKL